MSASLLLRRVSRLAIGLFAAAGAFAAMSAAPVVIGIDAAASPRIEYGAGRLAEAFGAGSVGRLSPSDAKMPAAKVLVGTAAQEILRPLIASGVLKLDANPPGHEGFLLCSLPGGRAAVVGGDDSGVLYGCLELARRVRAREGQLPCNLRFADAPVFTLRGPCIGMQKTYILQGRHVYEYPYTPELFPFFYDRAFWHEYLDFLAENRMNTLYLWNGHPFASLVKLPDYPYALEVPDEVFERNAAMMRYITEEADRRGIWVVQMFYNIILSKPFAERNHLATQLAAPNPVAADYTRKSIAEFVRRYPNVGLMACLGEALQGIDNQVQWCTQVILPGVKDGMAAAGLTAEPPVVIRTHATDARVIMPEALKVYRNLYTEAKFNGESLTTWEPRGARQDLHLAMSRLGSMHLINVHILANLEPFRYGAQRFIQKSMQAARDRLGARGVHLYPLSYWNWPDAPDKVSPGLPQWRRDWMWFEAWGRYAWNPDIDAGADRAYWLDRLTAVYGTRAAAGRILDAVNDAGECAPRLLRRFGITEGNRQTLSLGMTLDELVQPERYRPFPELWESQSPPGERLQEYAEREWNRQPHEGETPPQIVDEVLGFSVKAAAEIDAAAADVTLNRAEFERLRNDIHCIRAMSQNYCSKVRAAMLVLRYRRSGDRADMEQAARFLAESLEHYRTLERLTRDTYVFANSMQTSQRRIPVPGGAGGKPANYHWTQLLGLYEKELADFQAQVDGLRKTPGAAALPAAPADLGAAEFTLRSAGAETYTVQTGSRIFTDEPWEIQSVAPQLAGLTGIRFARAASGAGTLPPIEFETAGPVRVLVGYVQSGEPGWRKAPELETDAAAGEKDANEPLLLNALAADRLPPVNVHAYSFGPGRHVLTLRGSGSYLILGVVKASQRQD